MWPLGFLASLVLQANGLTLEDHRVDVTCAEYQRRGLVIPAQQFRKTRLVEIAKEFVRKPGLPTYAILVITESSEYMAYYSGKGYTDSNYGNWDHQLSLNSKQHWNALQNVAEVFVIRGVGAVKIRIGRDVETVLLSSTTPTGFGTDKQLQLLEIKSSGGNTSFFGCQLTFFFRSKATLSKRELEQIGRDLQKDVPNSDIVLFARPDTWFITHSDFPVIYAFDSGMSIPTRKEFKEKDEVALFIARRKIE